MRELNHKLQEKTRNLHGGNLTNTTTSTTLSPGPGATTVTPPPYAAASVGGVVLNSVHNQFRDIAAGVPATTVRSSHPHWEGSPIKHPEMKVNENNKSTIAVELHSPTSSGASQEQPDAGQLISIGEVTPADMDGEIIPTSQVVVLDHDAQCVLSGVDGSRKVSNTDGSLSPTNIVTQRITSANKVKI